MQLSGAKQTEAQLQAQLAAAQARGDASQLHAQSLQQQLKKTEGRLASLQQAAAKVATPSGAPLASATGGVTTGQARAFGEAAQQASAHGTILPKVEVAKLAAQLAATSREVDSLRIKLASAQHVGPPLGPCAPHGGGSSMSGNRSFSPTPA